MKAIAVRQPYAWLIVNGYKDIENRTWSTKHRGPLLIHASLKIAPDWVEVWWACEDSGIPLPDYADVGGIVGVVEVVDVVTTHTSPWFSGPVGFVLANARPLSFREFKGRLGLFETGLTLDDFIGKK